MSNATCAVSAEWIQRHSKYLPPHFSNSQYVRNPVVHSPAATTQQAPVAEELRGERALLLFLTNQPLQCLICTSKH